MLFLRHIPTPTHPTNFLTLMPHRDLAATYHMLYFGKAFGPSLQIFAHLTTSLSAQQPSLLSLSSLPSESHSSCTTAPCWRWRMDPAEPTESSRYFSGITLLSNQDCRLSSSPCFCNPQKSARICSSVKTHFCPRWSTVQGFF